MAASSQEIPVYSSKGVDLVSVRVGGVVVHTPVSELNMRLFGRTINMKVWKFALMAGAAAVLACEDDAIGPDDANVGVRFDVVEPASGEVGVHEGTNGTLEIAEIRMITDELRLASVDGACDGDAITDDCQEFDLDPVFLDLSLSGTSQEIRENVIPGSYVALAFTAQAADDGVDVPQDVLDEIREDYPDWPLDASAVVTGTFTPAAGGDAQEFVVFLAADQRLSLDFATPLEVTGDDDDRTVTVMLDLEAWFGNEDGTVLDLSQFDFELTDQLLDLQTRFQDGFAEVEVGA